MPDEDKTFSGFFVLDLRIWWRQVHTLYSQIGWKLWVNSSRNITGVERIAWRYNKPEAVFWKKKLEQRQVIVLQLRNVKSTVQRSWCKVGKRLVKHYKTMVSNWWFPALNVICFTDYFGKEKEFLAFTRLRFKTNSVLFEFCSVFISPFLPLFCKILILNWKKH